MGLWGGETARREEEEGGVFNGPIRRVPELADLKTPLNCLLNNGKEDTVLCIFNHD